MVVLTRLGILAASARDPHPEAVSERDAATAALPKELVIEGQRLAREWTKGQPMGKARLTEEQQARILASHGPDSRVGARPPDQRSPGAGRQESASQFPPKPERRPGGVSCNTRCVNGDCFRTYDDGRTVRFQARQKWNPFANQFEWDSGTC